MARSDTYATPIRDAAAPYVARTVVGGADAGKALPLIVAPPNSHLSITSIGVWGNDTSGGVPTLGLIPPATVKDANGFYDLGTDSFYACYSIGQAITGITEDNQVGIFPSNFSGRSVIASPWIIPAGWTLCVAQHITPTSNLSWAVSAVYHTTYQTSNFEG